MSRIFAYPDWFTDLGHQWDVWHQKYENQKEGLQNYLENSLNYIFNIFHNQELELRIRNADP